MLSELFGEISQKMKIDFQGITSRIEHNGEKGIARENTLENALKKYIPDKYIFSKGMIIDSKDEQSRQVDIIIHDKMHSPILLNLESTRIIPIESVYGVIEVKSRLTKNELTKAIKNVESVRKLSKKTMTGMCFPTFGYLFAYDSDSSLETVYKNFVELSKDIDVDYQISCICVLNKGLIIPLDKNNLLTIKLFPEADTVFAIFDDSENALLIFYLILFQTLNSIMVFPPNMLEYAQSSGTLKSSFIIPGGYLPEDATFSYLGHSASIRELNDMQKLGEKYFSGALQKDEFLACEFGMLIPLMIKTYGTLDKVPENAVFQYYDISLNCREFIHMYYIFIRKESASLDELDRLHAYETKLYDIYDCHRADKKKQQS